MENVAKQPCFDQNMQPRLYKLYPFDHCVPEHSRESYQE